MAQLIKLYDYVSRYEWNMFRYPGQFIRLKKENWDNLYNDWLTGDLLISGTKEESSKEKTSNFEKLKNLFTRSKTDDHLDLPTIEPITTELELRKYFLDHLFPFQLKWATSTISEMSVIDRKVEQDETLKYFLQRLPDIYLLMYYPVFNIRKAPIDGDIVLISPTEVEIISLLELEENAVILSGDERQWSVEMDDRIEHRISPLISLRRTESIIKSILSNKDIHFPIKRSIVSRKNQIIFHTEPYNVNIIGKNEYDRWLQSKRNISSPLKKDQLIVADALIQYCVSSSVRRPEWDQDDDIFPVGE